MPLLTVPVEPQQTVYYKRARFSTRLPIQRLYTPAHYWLKEWEKGVWRIGLTRFATRMLGDIVEHEFNVAPRAAVKAGAAIGWIEGFKAISDVFCVADGQFAGDNPALATDLTLIDRDHYDLGWLYAVRGTPGTGSLDVDGYVRHLDSVIDLILSHERVEGDSEC